jgi:hypothetical protein
MIPPSEIEYADGWAAYGAGEPRAKSKPKWWLNGWDDAEEEHEKELRLRPVWMGE